MNGTADTAQRHRRRGFTILEVLLSSVIVAMVLTIVYAAFSVGSRACRFGAERAQIFHTARIAMQDIIQSIENLEYGQTNYLSMIGDQGSASYEGTSVGDDELTFATTTSPALLDGQWQAGLARVRYRINHDLDPRGRDTEGEKLSGLEKLVSRVEDEDLDDAYAVELSRDVVGLSFRYYDETDFDKSWDSDIKERLPEYVEITLHVREGENIHLLRSGALIPHMTLDDKDNKRVERTAPETPEQPSEQPRQPAPEQTPEPADTE